MTRTPVALAMIKQTMSQLKQEGLDGARELYGRGLITRDTVIDGVRYELRYAAIFPGKIRDLRSASSAKVFEAAPARTNLNAVQIVGYVNCLTLWPFTTIKMGPTFELTFRRE